MAGFHQRPGVPHGVMVSQAPSTTSSSSGTSELRAVLSQPSKLVQQQQEMIQQRMQQEQRAQQERERQIAQQREREMREREAAAQRERELREREAREREQHLRAPRSQHQDRQSPAAPIMSAHHRLPFHQEPMRPSKHAEPKVSPSAIESRGPAAHPGPAHPQLPADYPMPPKEARDGRPGSAFNPPDGRLPVPGHPADVRAPGLPHPERMGVPPHMFPGDVRFPHPAMPPYASAAALRMGVPGIGMDPRMMFPPGSAEHQIYLQQLAFADKQMQNLIAQQHGMQHSPHELPGLPGERVGSRPPSRPTSAQPSPGVTPSPHSQHSPGALPGPHAGLVPAPVPPAAIGGRPSIPGPPHIMGPGHEAPGSSDPLFVLLQVSYIQGIFI